MNHCLPEVWPVSGKLGRLLSFPKDLHEGKELTTSECDPTLLQFRVMVDSYTDRPMGMPIFDSYQVMVRANVHLDTDVAKWTLRKLES
ncbi:uncharacterized protein PHALS_09590 [Plasmopara halstedii]|uniref:Uncharacterized protein n=1 Tax=Plasmopara halstedii TaxID=4781 RepID=A0A0P1AEA4_PLAHL|nr:uncharacterized protein PHALS_09590 [Plasmopara halstedii]CEG39336.1 hypothetical protein PHALS_09590 [Plasmopara halstedii]|eukprot:XP_024575705.1 hypothetical protein PHALS_09590 [Plasmopara halstedii]